MARRICDVSDLSGQRVLVRLDLNVPIRDGQITDRTRIIRPLQTVRALQQSGARVIVISHLGRPAGVVQPDFSLRPVSEAFAQELDCAIDFCEIPIGDVALQQRVSELADGQVMMLENLRFYPGEIANDPDFVAGLAALADIYVNDAFSVSHREHASVYGIAQRLPSYMGSGMIDELAALSSVMQTPERPVMAVIGGSKVSTKINLLESILPHVNMLVIGGAMANTFLAQRGFPVGRSLYEVEQLSVVKSIYVAAQKHGCQIILPSDVVVAGELSHEVVPRTVSAVNVKAEDMILDIGPNSVRTLRDYLVRSKTLLWNGPLGAFEVGPFAYGTMQFARLVAQRTGEGLISVAGGGDTVAAVNMAGVMEQLTYVSTAGGAFLEWLQSQDLPGVRVLGQQLHENV